MNVGVVVVVAVTCLGLAQTSGQEMEFGPKIGGGTPVENDGDFAHQVFLSMPRPDDGKPPVSCGASIIHPLLLLTAAHCFEMCKNASLVSATAGEIHLDRMKKGFGQPLKVHSIVIHPKFNESLFMDNDIAIVTLKEPVKFDSVTKAITIAGPNQNISGKVVVSGWGQIQANGGLQNTLQSVELDIIDRERCAAIWKIKKNKTVTDNNICAGDEEYRLRDACQGDSGGPLTSWDEKIQENFLFGIVSYGAECGTRVFIPGIYTDVRKYHRWIQKYMRTWWKYYWNMRYGEPLEDLDGNKTCGNDSFECEGIRRCIPKGFKCDGDFDCADWDKSDEENCAEIRCTRGRFRCPGEPRCFPVAFRCDGDADCEDGFDESDCPSVPA